MFSKRGEEEGKDRTGFEVVGESIDALKEQGAKDFIIVVKVGDRMVPIKDVSVMQHKETGQFIMMFGVTVMALMDAVMKQAKDKKALDSLIKKEVLDEARKDPAGILKELMRMMAVHGQGAGEN